MVLGSIEELKKISIRCITMDEFSWVLIHQSDQFYLLDNHCPHKGALLCEGESHHDEILCPWHKARFDIKTGQGLSTLAGEGVKSWPLIIKDGQLSVDLR